MKMWRGLRGPILPLFWWPDVCRQSVDCSVSVRIACVCRCAGIAHIGACYVTNTLKIICITTCTPEAVILLPYRRVCGFVGSAAGVVKKHIPATDISKTKQGSCVLTSHSKVDRF